MIKPILTVSMMATALLLAVCPADAEERELSLTVYNNDLAVVRDQRAMEIASGIEWLKFRDVPERIDPTSVHLTATDGEGLEVLEQNYVYDLVSPEKILDRYLEHQIQAITEDGRLYEGTLLSHSGGRVVLSEVEGQSGLVILMVEKITDLRFPELPEGLITRPTLEWLLAADRGGTRNLEVSYMTGGMNWHAEYVAVVDADDENLDLAGWVSLENHSGATYPDAELQLVAGEPHRVMPTPEFKRGGRPVQALSMADETGFQEETFFEYHLYTLGRETTLKNNETKQVSLFNPAACEVEKIYEANPQRHGKKVRVVLETTNSEEMGLGMPLPKGKIRVYKEDSRGRLQFVGEDGIDHTPRDEKVRVFVGNAFDLVVERTEKDRRNIGSRTREWDLEVELRNRKEDEDVTILLAEDVHGDWTVLEASHAYEKKNSRRIEFDVPVRAGEVVTVTFTVRTTW